MADPAQEPTKTLEAFIGELHSIAFFKEFTFSKTQFSPIPQTELQLADSLIWLGDALIAMQTKERSREKAGDDETERRWFNKKVLKRATRQIRDSLAYLQTHSEIRLTNERGHTFNLGGGTYSAILKIVVYLPAVPLPDDCRRIKHHQSTTTNAFIHVISASGYLNVCRTLRTPADIIGYFQYREEVITKFRGALDEVTEPMLVGHFIGGNREVAPSVASIEYLKRFVQDSEAWNIAPLLASLHKTIEKTTDPYDYYKIMLEFAKLPRSGLREVKTRFQLCLQKTREEKFALPYRIAWPATGCGFIFIPVDPKLAASPDFPKLRQRGVENFTLAHKYDQKLSKCVGASFAKDGEYYLIDWCLVEFPWEHDEEMERWLSEKSPLREVKMEKKSNYVMRD